MIITKKSLLASALVLTGAFGTASAAIVDCTDGSGRKCAQFDVIIRDFESTHPDFENFTEEAYTSINHSNQIAYDHSKSCASGEKDCVGTIDTWTTPGYQNDENWKAKRYDYNTWGCGNTSNPELGLPIGKDGYPKVTNPALPAYLQTKVSTSGYAWYGEFTGCVSHPTLNPNGLSIMRGLAHDLCASEAEIATWQKDTKDSDKKCDLAPVCNKNSWSQIVYITPGMVQQQLTFDPAKGDDMMYEPTIKKARDACDNQYFDQWFAGNNKRSNMPMELPAVDGPVANLYEIDYNRNNGGYFPLDNVDPNGMRVGPREGTDQYGAQSLSIFCPPYDYAYAGAQVDYKENSTADLCNAWKLAGGPKTPAAAEAAAGTSPIGALHLRNYSLTMMGYIKFKYKKGAGEIFEFAGDDDMWIYVDGVLAVDLGGTHLAAPGKADMDFLAQNAHGCHDGEPLAGECKLDESGTWADGSWHHLHFFYADRQTDGSNMKIHSTISEMAASRYGAPAIGEAIVKPNEDGAGWTTNLVLSNALNEKTMSAIAGVVTSSPSKEDAAKGSPIIVQRPMVDEKTGLAIPGKYEYFVYVLSSFEYKGESNDGSVYSMSGSLFKVNEDGTFDETPQDIKNGDAITFNYQQTDVSLDTYIKGVTDSPWMKENTITGTNGLTTANPDWGTVTIKAVIEEHYDVVDKTITRPDFPAHKVTTSGDELSVERTADLQIVILPDEATEAGLNAWLSAKSKENTNMTNQQYWSSTIVSGKDGVKTLNKSGDKPLCYNQNGVESCPSISFPVNQPFRLNVRVFDHLGHFISQYTKHMTKEDIEKLVPKGDPSDVTCSGKPTFGALLVSAQLYPISQNGRKLATGPYIYQVSVVLESWGGDKKSPAFCSTLGGKLVPQYGPDLPYKRSSYSKVMGYRRK